MKLFEIGGAHNYFIEKLENISKGIELELIFGAAPKTNPITKKVYLNLIDKCKENYTFISEECSLDIRKKFKSNVSNIRCTLNGIDNIKKYCKQDNLNDIDNVEYIIKTFYKNSLKKNKKFFSMKDTDYNVRLNIKNEKQISDNHKHVIQFLSDFETTPKHYRYKKRFSFLTSDKLFRIDLTVVKETNYNFNRKTFEFAPTFRKANILNNKEKYELELEYIGDLNTETGLANIDELYKSIKENYVKNGPSEEVLGNIYDPLNLGIHIFEDTNDYIEAFNDDDFSYDFDSPRYDDDKNEDDNVAYEKYTSDEYQKMIGRFVRVKDSYFKENSVDLRIRDSLKEYYEKGHNITILDSFTNDTTCVVKLDPPIGEISQLNVPITDVYFSPTFSSPDPDSVIKYDFEDKDEFNEPLLPIKYSSIDFKNMDDINALSLSLVNILEGHVIHLSKIIYNTDNLMSYSTKENVIDHYRFITGQKKKKDRINNHYFKLIAPQPVTLNFEHLQINNPKSILFDYAVTEKADGERYQLFVTKNKGYLINAKMNVIDIDTQFPDVDDDWIFDGEYITKMKDNSSTKLYMIFDVYWAGKKLTGQPIHTYPFTARNPWDISRYSVMNDFFIKNKVITTNNSVNLRVKKYEFGFQNINDDDDNEKKPTKKNKTEIFKAANSILKRDDADSFPYRIDGLIFIPTRVPVKGSIECIPPSSINGTWDMNYKWKPPHENTIDFLVKIKKTVIKGNIKDEIIPQLTYNDEGVKTLIQCKQFELYVGYDERKDDTLKFYMKVLSSVKEEKNDIQLFNINAQPDKRYNTTNISLDNGKILCENSDEINDGDFVEMRFNKNAKSGMEWEPLRVRSDKLRPQFFSIANNVWETIQTPITDEMIRGNNTNIDELTDIQSEKGKYYVNQDDNLLFESNPLRKLHNYIKSQLIGGICTMFKNPKILDLSCGQGGDINKYTRNRYEFLLGLDISSNFNDACKRYYFDENKKGKAAFLRGDTSNNIKSGACATFETNTEEDSNHTKVMVDILYGYNKPFPKEYTNINKKYNSLAKSGFDVISSQFSMHYYFKTQETFQGFLNNLKDNLNKGGYFIGTCYNGQKIFDHFKTVNDRFKKVNEDTKSDSEGSDDEESEDEEYNEYGLKDLCDNQIFSIKKRYLIDNFDYNRDDFTNMFGHEIDVFMDSIGQTITEYLVNFEFFTDIMEKNGFKLTRPNPRNAEYSQLFKSKYFNNGLGQFSNIIDNIPTIEMEDPSFNRFYRNAKLLHTEYSTNPLATLSSFNNYFIFQKV